MSESPNLEKWARVRRTLYETPEQRAVFNSLGCSGCTLCKPVGLDVGIKSATVSLGDFSQYAEDE